MTRYVSDAYALLEQFPGTWEALRAGQLTDKHVAVILEHGGRLTDPDDRGRYEALVLPEADTETPGGLGARARIIAERVHPISLQERHDTAVKDRCVFVTDLADGMSELRALLTSVEAHGIYNRLSKQAHLVKTAAGSDDARGIDQIRADLLTDMLLTADPHHVAEGVGLAPCTLGEIHADVQITVPVLTLARTDTDTGTSTSTGTDAGAGADSDPAMLNGRVPIDPATARRLAGTASGWDRVLTHPITGAVLTVDRYTPNADLKRFLTARDQHCRFPGCRTRHTDIDHTVAWADGGKTTVGNLALLCRRHLPTTPPRIADALHGASGRVGPVLKHESPWTVVHKPGGTLEWVSPAGRHHSTRPPGMVQFTPSQPEPPGSKGPPGTEPTGQREYELIGAPF